MKVNEIETKINEVKENVDKINSLMRELHSNDVEIRINYKDSAGGEPPQLDLWRAIAHVNYLK